MFSITYPINTNGLIFKYVSGLLTVGGIICLILDKIDGYVDYWFNYEKFK